MELWNRVYFNAVFGGIGGLVGWMLFGLFGEVRPTTESAFAGLSYEDLNALLGGAIVGGAIGYFVVAVDAIRDQSLARFFRVASYGMGVGAVGGAIGMLLGDVVNAKMQERFGLTGVFFPILVRGIGWSFLGIAIGIGEGVAARSLGKFSYGTLGGAIGGFVGGVVYDVFYRIAQASLSTSYLFGAIGLVILGACIGALSAFVQAVFQPACVRVLRGWQEGREYPLDKPQMMLGRAEHADIALFRDMKVEKAHAIIRQQGDDYVLVNNGSPADQTRVNDTPVSSTRPLSEGDRIQLGGVILRFHRREAKNRVRRSASPRPSGERGRG